MWSAVWSSAPQSQQDDVFMPQQDRQELKHPTPVLRRFRVTHSFLARSDPGGRLSAGETPNSVKRGRAELHKFVQASMMSNWEHCSDIA